MNRSTSVFILIALSLAAYIFLVDSKEKGTKEKEASKKKLFELTSSKIDKLTVVNDEMTIEMTKKGSHWQIIKPIVTEADTTVVEQIVSELEFVETRRTIPINEIENLDATLKQWSLATPTTQIIASGDGKKHELNIGRKIAVSDLYYARKSSDKNAPVELISSFSRNNFTKKLNDLRTKDVLKFVSSDLRKITIKQSKGESANADEKELTLENSQWTLQKPIKARSDHEQINSWIANILGIKATRFLSDDNSNLNGYGLSNPKTQFTFSFDEKPEQTLLIGSPTSDQPTEVYAKLLHSNTVFTLKLEATQKLIDQTNEWRDKHLIPPFTPAHVTTLKIETKNKTSLFNLEENQWVSASNPSFKANADKINEIIRSLQELQSTQFVKETQSDLKSYGLDKPQARLIIEGKNGEQSFKRELILGKTDKNITYAANTDEPFIVAISASFSSDWPKEIWQWKSLQVLGSTKNDFKKITISDRKGARASLVTSEKEKWISENQSETLNPTSIDAVVNQLSTLKAIRWIGTTTLPIYELQNPVLKVEITTASGTKTLKIGNALPTGGRVAQLESNEPFFEINQNDFEILNQNLHSTSTSTLPENQVTSTPAESTPLKSSSAPQAPQSSKASPSSKSSQE